MNFIAVDDTVKIRVCHDSVGGSESSLNLGVFVGASKDVVEGLESTFSPNDESSQMTTGGKLQQIQRIHVGKVDSWDVSEGLDQLGGAQGNIVHNEGSQVLEVAAVSGLTLTSPHPAGRDGLLHIIVSVKRLQEGDGILSLGEAGDLRVSNDQGDFIDVVDLVSSRDDERGDSSGSQSRADSVSALSDVDLSVPPSVDLGRGKHTTSTTHVTEGTLASTMSTTTGDTGDT